MLQRLLLLVSACAFVSCDQRNDAPTTPAAGSATAAATRDCSIYDGIYGAKEVCSYGAVKAIRETGGVTLMMCQRNGAGTGLCRYEFLKDPTVDVARAAQQFSQRFEMPVGFLEVAARPSTTGRTEVDAAKERSIGDSVGTTLDSLSPQLQLIARDSLWRVNRWRIDTAAPLLRIGIVPLGHTRFPQFRPRFQSMMIDPLGNLWLQQVGSDNRIVIRRDGQLLGTVAFPRHHRVFAIGDSWILTSTRTEFDVPYLALLRIIK